MGSAPGRGVNCLDVPSILASEPRDTACERLAGVVACCQCENESVQPDFSPGVVADYETLARFVAPIDFDTASGTVKPSLFGHARRMGMSVTRIEHAGLDGLARQQGAKGYLGYVVASCADIREVLTERRRGYCVYDTALQDNPAHADICQAVFEATAELSTAYRKLSKSEQSAIRYKLQLVFGRVPLTAGSHPS